MVEEICQTNGKERIRRLFMGTNKQVKFSEMDVHVRKQWEVELTGQAGNELWKALNAMLRNASSFVGKGDHLEALNKRL